MRRLRFHFLFTLALVGPASAADLYPVEEPMPAITEPGGFEARWNVAGAVYLFAPSLEGTVGVGGLPTVDVDASFSDLLDYLDFAFMAVAEARRDRIGILQHPPQPRANLGQRSHKHLQAVTRRK